MMKRNKKKDRYMLTVLNGLCEYLTGKKGFKLAACMLLAICECKFSFCGCNIIHFTNDVLQTQCIRFILKVDFHNQFRKYFTIQGKIKLLL
jgi:hypothetical protein